MRHLTETTHNRERTVWTSSCTCGWSGRPRPTRSRADADGDGHLEEEDRAGSASRQHFVDTGRYLRYGEVL